MLCAKVEIHIDTASWIMKLHMKLSKSNMSLLFKKKKTT